jgi:hypothetical protein
MSWSMWAQGTKEEVASKLDASLASQTKYFDEQIASAQHPEPYRIERESMAKAVAMAKESIAAHGTAQATVSANGHVSFRTDTGEITDFALKIDVSSYTPAGAGG